VKRVSELGVKVVLDHGYGRGMGLQESEYTKDTDLVCFARHDETYQQDLLLVLRYPNDEELRIMRPGSCLISMIHFPTRPGRIRFLRDLGLEAISLDYVKDATGRSLVEDLRAVGWNGVEVAFKTLRKKFSDFENPNRQPIHITLLGPRAVGGYAVQAAVRYGNLNLWQSMAQLIRTIIEAGGVQNINPHGRFFHRALARAMLSRWSIHNND